MHQRHVLGIGTNLLGDFYKEKEWTKMFYMLLFKHNLLVQKSCLSLFSWLYSDVKKIKQTINQS